MRTETITLLDAVLPEWDHRSRHERHVLASPHDVGRAMERYRLDRHASPLARLLFALRGLRIPGGSVRDAVTESGFTLLAERRGEELVFGTTGRFWTLREQANVEAPPDLAAFRAFARPGWAKAALTLRVVPRPDGWATLATETRVICVDERARRRFLAYWTLIRSFSGLIRRDLLAGIAGIAEETR